MILAGSATALSAQYLGYPTAGVPKGPDGKPNMAAPAPRTADGHPDFTGMYGWVTRANCGAKCNDTQIPDGIHQYRIFSQGQGLAAKARGVGHPKGARSGTG